MANHEGGGLNERKCPGFCSGPSHGWTHCPLFLKLLVTLGQLDGTGRLPWAWPPPSAHGRQPVWQDGSQPLGLGEGLCHGKDLGITPSVFAEFETPSSGHLGCQWAFWKLHLLRTRNCSDRKAESSQPLVRGAHFLPVCRVGPWLSWTCRSEGPSPSVRSSLSRFGGSVLQHRGVCAVRKGPGQPDLPGFGSYLHCLCCVT